MTRASFPAGRPPTPLSRRETPGNSMRRPIFVYAKPLTTLPKRLSGMFYRFCTFRIPVAMGSPDPVKSLNLRFLTRIFKESPRKSLLVSN